jgi:hypothetical protein
MVVHSRKEQCLNLEFYFSVGNFKNLPLTVAKRYQIKEYADTQETVMNIVKNKHGVEIGGTDYRVGDYLVVEVNDTLTQPVFGKIKSMLPDGSTYQFTCAVVETFFCSHYHAYQVTHETEEIITVKQNILPYLSPASLVHTDNGLIFLCIRHVVL